MDLAWLATGAYADSLRADNAKIPYALAMNSPAIDNPACPDWAWAMKPGYWYRISGDTPDLGL